MHKLIDYVIQMLSHNKTYLWSYERSVYPEYDRAIKWKDWKSADRILCKSGTAHIKDIEMDTVTHECVLDMNGGFVLPHAKAFSKTGSCIISGTFICQRPIYINKYYRITSWRYRMTGTTILCEDQYEQIPGEKVEISAEEYVSNSHDCEIESVLSHYDDIEQIELISTVIKYDRSIASESFGIDELPHSWTNVIYKAHRGFIHLSLIINGLIACELVSEPSDQDHAVSLSDLTRDTPVGLLFYPAIQTIRMHEIKLIPMSGHSGDCHLEFIGTIPERIRF